MKEISVFTTPSDGFITFNGYIASEKHTIRSGRLRLLTPNPKLGLKATAQRIHPLWVNRSLPRRWKDCCDHCHGAECDKFRSGDFLFPSRPEWVIDVWRLCLVPGSTADEYVALSYVWGERSFVTATRGNFTLLQSPGALSELPIPDTIRDAFGFTEMLGVRYLWVDSLCIAQDNTQAKYAEIGQMSAIFANASVTIIAANGSNAYSGLPGLQGISSPRTCKQDIFNVGRGSKILLQQWQGSETSVWSTRAWTFQELLFSRRRVIFEGDYLRWECSNAFWFEDVIQMDGLLVVQNDVVSRQSMISSRFPDPTGLAYLLRGYNVRDLTYPEDAVIAFVGVMRALRPAFKDGFLSGLPLAFFHIALLWQPHGHAIRRVARRTIDGGACLPSWSWAGWKCELDSRSWAAAKDYVKRHPSIRPGMYSERVVPHVQWYSHQSLRAEGTPIRTEWYEYRKKYLNADTAPPAGWTKYHLSEGSWDFVYTPDLGLTPNFFYRHEFDPESEFWYPIPLPHTADDPTFNFLAPFLSCRTHRVWLFGGQCLVKHPTLMLLNDKNGTYVGELQLLESPPPKDDNLSEGDHLRKALELVEVSKGYAFSGQRNDLLGIRFSESGVRFEFYHVMWIEREGQVAYRKGLGRVLKEVWEAQDRELIDLMLG